MTDISNDYPLKFDSSKLNEEEKVILSAFLARRKIFDTYLANSAVQVFTCPGCAFPTLTSRGGCVYCIVCSWEDDDQDDLHADEIWGGPNGSLSLTENRINIGKQLKEIAERRGGKINDEPKSVIATLTIYEQKFRHLFSTSSGQEDKTHSTHSEYDQLGQSLLNELITK